MKVSGGFDRITGAGTALARMGAVVLAATLSFGVVTAGMFAPVPAQAQTLESDLQNLNNLIKLPETFDIMRLEGLENDKSLAEDLFGNREDPTWARTLDKIYATDRMTGIYNDALSAVLQRDGALVGDVTPFLASELGQRIIGLELEARRTTLDPIALGAAREVYAELAQTDKPRSDLIERLVVAGDLMEGNVSTALNANIAFSRAIAKAGGAGAIDEDELLANVWALEPEVRVSVADFIYPLMALAYAPLSDDELTRYVEFFESDVGQRFNAALMTAFEPVMIDLSGQLGAEAGRLMSGQAL